MKKDWIKEAYRRWFARLDEEVPGDVWNEIADQLDIDEVWDNIRPELNKGRELFPWRWIARTAAVLLLLFSALAAYWYLSPSRINRENQLSTQTAPPGEKLADNGTGKTPPEASTPFSRIEAGDGRAPDKRTPDGNDPHSGDPDGGDPDGSGELRGVPHTDGRTAIDQLKRTVQVRNITAAISPQSPQAELPDMLLPDTPGEQLAGAPVAGDPATSSGGKQPFIRLQRLGMVSAYNNTWMLNHETFNGLQASTLNATTFTYGSSAAINAGFLVNGKHKIGAELYLSSRTGQGYRQYIEARYQSRNIQLDYYKIQLYYQLPVFAGKGDVLAGAYGSYLKRGREKIAGEARTISRFYRDMDYGIMTGYQFNLPVNNRLLVQPGIRINYGLPNIFKGNQQIPENFLRTHNAAAGIYLGVSYRLY